MKVVWTERGDALGRYPDRGRKLPEIPGGGLRERVVDRYRVVYHRMLNTFEVLTVFEGHRLLRDIPLCLKILD